jgi:molybdopterin-guanine dinucleotide biosynthesis protein A
MGGGDKGLLELAASRCCATSSIGWPCRFQQRSSTPTAIPAALRLSALPVVADTVEGFVGPLAGVLAGMRWSIANAPAARWIVTAPGDAPLLPRDLVERLMEAVAEREDSIAIAQSGGEVHPVIGLWPIALMRDLEEQLKAGVRKVLDWTGRHGTVAVAFPCQRFCGLSIDPFYNANTPQELGELRAMLRKTSSP